MKEHRAVEVAEEAVAALKGRRRLVVAPVAQPWAVLKAFIIIIIVTK